MYVMASFLPGQDVTRRYTKNFLPKWFTKKVNCMIPPIDFSGSPRTQKPKKPFFLKKAAQNHLKKVDA